MLTASLSRSFCILGLTIGLGLTSLAQSSLSQVKTVFVIAMENHNFQQPNPTSSPQQLSNNPAAPYLNSLITRGNSNALHVAYATHYYNAGAGVHPSEPSYIWAEGGTDFGIHTDNDPRDAYSNIFTNGHLTRQMNVAGIAWKSYQEDIQFSPSPTNSASGTAGSPNSFYGTGQYNYAVKHNPMAFYTDTQTQNVYPLFQLFSDLTNHAVGQYNWITPNQYNDMHSALSGGFTYQGTYYTGDQAAVAQGDNFLSQIVPIIQASTAYKDHGLIILWWDESEIGDTAAYSIPEIIISPLARGNAYASSIELNHSSDLKTMEELFGLPYLSNSIPASETSVSGGYNNVATVNNLNDLFLNLPMLRPPTFTSTGTLQLEFSGLATQTYQVLTATNLATPIANWLTIGSGTFGTTNTLFDTGKPTNSSQLFRIQSP
jgi:hypothetical protein